MTTASAPLTVVAPAGIRERATFHGEAVEIVRGRHVTRIPVTAIHDVEVHAYGLVVQLTGRSDDDVDHAAAQRMGHSSVAAARTFATAVRAAAEAAGRRPNGLSQVTSTTRAGNPFGSWWFRILFVEALLGLVLLVTYPYDENTASAAGMTILLSALLGPCAWLVCRFAWDHMLRDPWILLRRGVMVNGEVLQHRRKGGDNALYYPMLRFTTEEGEQHEVLSCVGRAGQGGSGRIALRYDPQDPGTRAGRTLTFSHFFWSLVLSGLALGLVVASAGPPIALLVLTFGG
ncbi:DUF3592 domain-containing protein [Streptomyces sp. NPDC051921]|uniref:DUF3592 domain-containing protein n=1 Tax=Streptomyces sp. NPDC051921 TaxID=3155806 RepID=UPI003436F19E